MSKSIGILGAGSWGATLAALLSNKGYSVTLWEFNPENAKELSVWRTLKFFPHLVIPKEIKIISNLKETVEQKDLVVFAVPSHALRQTAKDVAALKIDLTSTLIVSATKGIENESLKRMSEIIALEIPESVNRIAALSGPTHAEEVSRKMPTTVTVASSNLDTAISCQNIFMTPYFRVYTSNDIIGVETGGALKNIFAIAAGICDGLGMGDNTKAAIVTRGIKELVRLGLKMGGEKATFYGLSGLGDLIVTCFSKHSRNRNIGEKIGAGKSLTQSEQELVMVAEGVNTTRSAYELSQRLGIEVPIIEQVYRILYENKAPKEALEELMLRHAKSETDIYE